MKCLKWEKYPHQRFILLCFPVKLKSALSEKLKKTTISISVAAMEGGGGTLSEIHQSAKKLLLRSRDGLERLERLEYSATAGTGADTELSFAVKKDITQIQSLCVEMERLWRSITAKPQRDLWKRWTISIPISVESILFMMIVHFWWNCFDDLCIVSRGGYCSSELHIWLWKNADNFISVSDDIATVIFAHIIGVQNCASWIVEELCQFFVWN